MKKFIILTIVSSLLSLAPLANAQMMGGYTPTPTASVQPDEDTAAGQALWNQLQSGQVKCAQLSDDNFDKLGDYYQTLMMGPSSTYMDQFMTNSLGANGEREMNIAMGKRLSGCNPNASYPNTTYGYAPMMQMMWRGGYGSGWNMMNTYGWYGQGSWLFIATAVLFWIVLLLVIVGLARWVFRSKK